MHTTHSLYAELHINLNEINRQIEAIKREIELSLPEGEKPDPDIMYGLNNGSGNFLLKDLLIAKAQLLSGMAALKAADMAQKAPKR